MVTSSLRSPFAFQIISNSKNEYEVNFCNAVTSVLRSLLLDPVDDRNSEVPLLTVIVRFLSKRDI